MRDLNRSPKASVSRLVDENLEATVKILMSDFEKSNTQLRSLLSGSQKLNNLLGLNKPARNMGDL